MQINKKKEGKGGDGERVDGRAGGRKRPEGKNRLVDSSDKILLVL